MKHSIIYKSRYRYASFPLLDRLKDGSLLIGFFTAPVPDHRGLFWWNTMTSNDEGETWHYCTKSDPPNKYDYIPGFCARAKSDTMTIETSPDHCIMTGSFGFLRKVKDNSTEVIRSQQLFYQRMSHGMFVAGRDRYVVPYVKQLLTFPRFFTFDKIILIPAYAILYDKDGESDGLNRCLVLRSEDGGATFHLHNMFPHEVDGNEMAFVMTPRGVLAHIRSDSHPFMLESWSHDHGKTWTYPTSVFVRATKGNFLVGGPPHLLDLGEEKILCTYGYRFDPMGIRAVVSYDGGKTWDSPIVLRHDGGYSSSLYQKPSFLARRKRIPSPANDVGYPVSIQLQDGSILTAYYITTKDRITHIAATKWRP